METEVITEEFKINVAKRCPPGDRWAALFKEDIVFDSLTDVLEFIYQEKNYTKFFIDARAGQIFAVETKESEIKLPEPKKYTLYDEY